MNEIWLWILISAVIGIVAGLIFINVVKTRDEDDVYSDDDDEITDDKRDDNDDGNASDESKSMHRVRNFFLVATVFSVLIFLVVWLVMALFCERIAL